MLYKLFGFVSVDMKKKREGVLQVHSAMNSKYLGLNIQYISISCAIYSNRLWLLIYLKNVDIKVRM